MDDLDHLSDICRVCRCEGAMDKPLFYPCLCTGSIKYIHQDCLVQWLKYSHKEYCELCKHRFFFTPIYSPDMPQRLPLCDIVGGLVKSIARAVRYWLHYTLVTLAWLGVVPLTACRIYRCFFTGSVSSLLTFPMDMLSTENMVMDSLYGFAVVSCTLVAFISLVWLREQILLGGGPDWLERNGVAANNNRNLGGGAALHLLGELAGGGNHHAAAAINQPHNAPDVGGAAGDERAAGNVGEDVDPMDDANNAGNVAQADDNWNVVEWDRAAEELTWERLLGLDGSLVFLEHVFWVISLNAIFILVFAFSPYHIGHFTLVALKVDHFLGVLRFEGLLTTLFGYLVIALFFLAIHVVSWFTRLKKFGRAIGLCYVAVKVMLLVVMEIGIFPLFCGWWLDICSLAMFEVTLKGRINGFHSSPFTSALLHWVAGMLYVFYFASFILVLREVFRPGVLWFLRNLNDPDFNPIQDMIHLPVQRHIRRFAASVVIFGSIVLLILYLPVIVIRRLFVHFFPFHVILSNELSMGLLLLQVIFPVLLEHGHASHWLKQFLHLWTAAIAYLLDLRSYLLGDVTFADGDIIISGADQDPLARNAGVGFGALHHAMLQDGRHVGFKPYKRPPFFQLHISLFLLLTSASLFVFSIVSLVVPVTIGRLILSLWINGSQIHELYTAACGLFVCWLAVRVLVLLYNWVPLGCAIIVGKLRMLAILALKSMCVSVVLLIFVPLLLGLLFELVVEVPLRASVDQTPLFFLWQDWALGVLLMKVICALTLIGPRWWLRRIMDQVYNDGLRNMNLAFILSKLAMPIVFTLGMALALPYVFVNSVLPVFGAGYEMQFLVWRRVYPCLVAVTVVVAVLVFQLVQFHRLYNHIKDDKYLVGRRLANYSSRSQAISAQ